MIRVIIPTYNEETTIQKTIEQLRKKDVENWLPKLLFQTEAAQTILFPLPKKQLRKFCFARQKEGASK